MIFMLFQLTCLLLAIFACVVAGYAVLLDCEALGGVAAGAAVVLAVMGVS